MDTTLLLLLIGGALVLLVGVGLFMLNRSWGDSLPTRIDIPRPEDNPAHWNAQKQQHFRSPPTTAPDTYPGKFSTGSFDDNEFAEDTFADDDQFPELDDATRHQTPVPENGLILITHPLLKEVIGKSEQSGGPATQYVVRDGDDLYVSLDLIQDPTQRREAAEMIQKFQVEGRVGVWDMINLATIFARNNSSR